MELTPRDAADLDVQLGVWLDEPYVLGNDVTRAYLGKDSGTKWYEAAKKCGAEKLFVKGPPRSKIWRRRGRLWLPGGSEGRLVKPPAHPPTPDAKAQADGEFDVYTLVCGNFSSGGACSEYGEKMSKSLIKVAATRIFANPYQCFAEIIVNSHDAYHPEEKIGKFGMGFFSVLWWLYKDPKAIMTIRSFVPGESWSLVLKTVDGDLKGHLRMLPECKVDVWGTEIEIDSSEIDIERLVAETSKLRGLGGISVAETSYDVSRGAKLADPAGRIIFGEGLHPLWGGVAFVDFATGIPLKVLAESLLVPSVSTKTIAGFGKVEDRLPTKVALTTADSAVSVSVGKIVIVQLPVKGYGFSYLIGLSSRTHIPVSRDDIIVNEEVEADIATQIEILLKTETSATLTALEAFVHAYAASGTPRSNVDAFSRVIYDWRERNYYRIVPKDHYERCYAIVDKTSIPSELFRTRDIEKKFMAKSVESPWLNIRLVVDPKIPKPTFGGLNSIIFTPTSDPQRISLSLANFLIASDPKPGSVDEMMRDGGVEPVAKLGMTRRALSAYTYLITVAAGKTAVVSVRAKKGASSTREVKHMDAIVYFAEWANMYYRHLPEEDFVDVVSHFAHVAAIATGLISVFDGATVITPDNMEMFVKAILSETSSAPHIISSPILEPKHSVFLKVCNTAEEYANMVDTVDPALPQDFVKFLLERLRIKGLRTDAGDAFYVFSHGSVKLDKGHPFYTEARKWVEVYSKDQIPARPPLTSTGFPPTYSIRSLISSLFDGSDVPRDGISTEGEMEFYRRAGAFPPTKLQTLDIATNDASTRSPVMASIVELYQNSLDAGAKTIKVTSRVCEVSTGYPKPLPALGHVVIEFEDMVGMGPSNFFHVQIPFLSTKTMGGSTAGEMGSGFFNVFRASDLVEMVSTDSKLTRTAIFRPVRIAGRIQDIEVTTTIVPSKGRSRGTMVRMHVPCETLADRVLALADAERTTHLASKAIGSPEVSFNGVKLVNTSEVKWDAPEFTIFTDGSSSRRGHAYTKGVYFGPSSSIGSEQMPWMSIDLKKGFEPVHSRNKISIEKPLLEKINFVAYLSFNELPMASYTHVMSQALPGHGTYVEALDYPIIGALGIKHDVRRLLWMISGRNKDRYRGTDPRLVKIIDEAVTETLGAKHEFAGLVATKLKTWAKTKVAAIGAKEEPEKDSPPEKPAPAYYDPPKKIADYITRLVLAYHDTCLKDPKLGMKKNPPKVAFYSNPGEIGANGFCSYETISLAIEKNSHPEYLRAIAGLSDPKTSVEFTRRMSIDGGSVWRMIGHRSGLKAPTMLHELEHYRRNEVEAATAHSPKVEDLFGEKRERSFDEAAIEVMSWVMAQRNIYLG